MACEQIMVIRINKRTESATTVQSVLTEYGCFIKTRLGLHDAGDDFCSDAGILILQLCGDGDTDLVNALNEIEGVQAKLVEFD